MPIRILPPHIVNQIAAGEVVERPSSVVKELVENSIDAGAKEIAVHIAGGGLSRILVRDDGSGMSADELRLALERHATSKLPEDDVSSIQHLGFRGEALPAIASIARVVLQSKRADDPHGWSVQSEGGNIAEAMPTAHPNGTSIEVRDLFYATPARLKFMKTPGAETAQILDMLRRLALANPQTGFSIADEDGVIANYPVTTADLFSQIQSRVRAVLGNEFAQAAAEIDAARDGIRVYGMISRASFSRGNAQMQYFTVNGRPVRDKQLYGALRGAYQDVLPHGRHPVVALYLELPHDQVDVNVHPAKAELRFRDAGAVRSLLIGSIRSVLATVTAARTPAQNANTVLLDKILPWPGNALAQSGALPTSRPQLGFVASPSARSFDNLAAQTATLEAAYPLGAAVAQIHANYIIAQTADGMVIVDQHAAHERIVYEALKTQLSAQSPKAQILLVPEVINFTGGEELLLSERADELAKLGLVIESFGRGAVLVREVPALIGTQSAAPWVRDVAAALADADGPILAEANLWKICATMACYGSIRSGRLLNSAEMNALLRQIENTPNGYVCNHGRPTVWRWHLHDIEKLFERR